MPKFFIAAITALVLTGCEPGLDGNLTVFNESELDLTIKYRESSRTPDTSYVTIPARGQQVIYQLGGIGSNASYDCCPAKVQIYSMTTSKGPIKKDPENCEVWEIPNKTRLKKFGGEPVHCELHIRTGDL